MAATILKETKSLSSIETSALAAAAVTAVAVEVETLVSPVKCCCCGLVEECTQAYISRVRDRYQGRWICGLCAEAVKEERSRSSSQRREVMMISLDEALRRHMKFCQQFRSSSPPNNTTEEFLVAMKNILFRNLDSPRKEISSNHFSACRPLGRSQSCFSTMQGNNNNSD